MHSNPLSDPAPVAMNPKDAACRDKLPVHLVPPELVREVATVLKNGAGKYGEFNWRFIPVNLSNYVAAIIRHSLCMLDGEMMDEESGLQHAAHIAATAAIILDAKRCGTLIEDLPGGRM